MAGYLVGTFRSERTSLAFTATLRPDVAEHFSVRDCTFTAFENSVQIVVVTDIPCHLFVRLSLQEPRTHKKVSFVRGLPLVDDYYYCFTVFEDNEQQEAGDTLTHTWLKPAWPVCTTKYFYLWGTIGGVVSPSTSCIFHYHNQWVQTCPYGDIGDALLDTEEYAPVWGFWSDGIKVTDGIVALFAAEVGISTGGRVTTYSINDAGIIGAEIDTWLFEAGLMVIKHGVVQVSPGIFLLAYIGAAGNIKLVTISINMNGTINKALVSSLQTARDCPIFPCSLARRGTDNIYAVGHTDGNSDGWITTYSVNPNGTNITAIAAWEYDPVRAYLVNICYAQNGVFALASYDNLSHLVIDTIYVSSIGNIAQPAIATLDVVAPPNTSAPYLLNCGVSDLFVVATCHGNPVYLYSFTVDNLGNLSAVLGSVNYPLVTGANPMSALLGTCTEGAWIILAAHDTGPDEGILATFTVAPDGTFSALLDELTDIFQPLMNGITALFQIQPDIWLFVFSDTPTNDGWFGTIQIT